MLRNLLGGYDENFSAPRTKDFVFYTKDESRFLFKKNEAIEICFAVTVRALRVKWKLCKNLFTAPIAEGAAEEDFDYTYIIKIDNKNLKPGFYDVFVYADNGMGREMKQKCTFGYDLENFTADTYNPTDFDVFWEKSLKKLDGIALDAKETPYLKYNNEQINDYNVMHANMTDDYDPEGHRYEEVVSGKVSFNSVGGVRIQGYIAKPAEDKKYPAMLILPGAGFGGRAMPLEHARHGYIALDIGVHGQSPEKNHMPSEEYQIYGDIKLGEDYYFNNVYLHCIQAINYLCSRADVDTSRIVLAGGSQGGRLSVVTAALDDRVTDIVAGIVHYSNLPYIHYAKQSNENGYNGLDEDFKNIDNEISKYEAYYDVINFAPRVKCRALLNGGLIDEVSPPEGVLGVYKNIASECKKLVLLPNMAHCWSTIFDKYAWRWLEKAEQ